MSPNLYIIAWYAADGNGIQLAAFITAQAKKEFTQWLTADIAAKTSGDWYVVANHDNSKTAILKAKGLGGTVYNLPTWVGP